MAMMSTSTQFMDSKLDRDLDSDDSESPFASVSSTQRQRSSRSRGNDDSSASFRTLTGANRDDVRGRRVGVGSVWYANGDSATTRHRSSRGQHLGPVVDGRVRFG